MRKESDVTTSSYKYEPMHHVHNWWSFSVLGIRARTSTAPLCKAKRQYLLTCKVSRYCILALHGSADIRNIKCIILCDNKLYKGSRAKFGIIENAWAGRILKAVSFLEDKIFVWNSDLQDSESYYHDNYIKNKYIDVHRTAENRKLCGSSPKQAVWSKCLPEIENGLMNGGGYKLGSNRDTVNTHLGKTECGNFRNRDIQLLL